MAVIVTGVGNGGELIGGLENKGIVWLLGALSITKISTSSFL